MAVLAPRRVAAILSIIGHPFILTPATVALMAGPRSIAAGIALAIVIVMLAVIARRVAAGRWSDYDVSDVQQRHGFYPIALTIVGVAALASWGFHQPPRMIRGMVVAEAMLIVGAVLTRWTKVSLHVMIGAFCVANVATESVAVACGLALLVIAVGWSRVVLQRHTVVQVIAGALIGVVAGAFVR